MTPDELLEKVARAICADDYEGDTEVFDLKNNGIRDVYRMNARAAITVALEQAARLVDESDSLSAGEAMRRYNLAAAIRALIKEPT